jgi:hypothetical protein
LNLAAYSAESYVRAMRAISRSLPVVLGSIFLSLAPLAAQDDAARAAAAADREAGEERYQRLNSAVESMLQSQADQQRRLLAVTEEVRRLSAQPTVNESQWVTRDEFNRLVETVKEIDRKREADKKQILEEISNLGKTLSTTVREGPRRSASASNTDTKPESKPESKSNGGRSDARDEEGGSTEKGTWHTIERGNTLSAIVSAYNEKHKAQGLKTSLKLIQEANPKLKPSALSVGQKIWIPLVPEKS